MLRWAGSGRRGKKTARRNTGLVLLFRINSYIINHQHYHSVPRT
nr:MAG TPA: hypothetical protein [Caudoviricetes sp.]